MNSVVIIGQDANDDFAEEHKAIGSLVTGNRIHQLAIIRSFIHSSHHDFQIGIMSASPRPKRVVVLSTIGAHIGTIKSVLYSLHLLEQALRKHVAPHIQCVFVRAGKLTHPPPPSSLILSVLSSHTIGGFFENVMWELPQARSESGIVRSYWKIDRAYPQLSSIDIGRVAAEQLLLPFPLVADVHDGVKIIELGGPQRYAPLEQGVILSKLLGKTVTYVDNPYDTWGAQFAHGPRGMKNPQLRMALMHNANQVNTNIRQFKVVACS